MHLSNRNKLSGRKGDEGAFIILSLRIKNFRDSITPLEKELIIPLRKSRYSAPQNGVIATFQQ